MEPHEFPIIEFDPERKALIEPKEDSKPLNVPKHCLIPFYGPLLLHLRRKGILRQITEFESSIIPSLYLYEMEYQDKPIAVMTPGLAAPFSAAVLEFAIATGCKKFLVFGQCGVLDKTIARNKLIIPTSAIRDEGTSYHYIRPSREVEVNLDVISKIKSCLSKKNIPYTTGKTWTTDAYYRETPEKIKKRKIEGAITVEMEAAALLAVAQFRGVQLGYILAGGDDVSGLEWDRRDESGSLGIQEKLFWLAAQICLEL